ncbi:hypothetical protein Tco_0206586 [Tanacetum coccineum]
MVSASKDPLTFNDLMATPIDFSKYVLNGLKIDNLTQDILLGPAFNLLKGTCSSSPLCHRTVDADYFFNNDLEYLKTSDPEVTYTTSITKTKAARYEIKGIDMTGPINILECHQAYCEGYCKDSCVHLEEIVVKRSDQQLYKFKEGDFVDLHLNDIEDMLLLAVQHKLFHLDGNVIVDFIVAHLHKNDKKSYAELDELYKFSDGTLKSVRDEIHHKVLDFRLDYNTKMPKRSEGCFDTNRMGLILSDR